MELNNFFHNIRNYKSSQGPMRNKLHLWGKHWFWMHKASRMMRFPSLPHPTATVAENSVRSRLNLPLRLAPICSNHKTHNRDIGQNAAKGDHDNEYCSSSRRTIEQKKINNSMRRGVHRSGTGFQLRKIMTMTNSRTQ